MSQNRSTAVMQRRVEAHDSLDDFPTPPWATRALCEWLRDREGYSLGDMTVREPAANRGYMVKPLAEYFGTVEASDVHDYGAGYPVQDYLFPVPLAPVDWTITNPPFRLAEQFVHRAFATSDVGVAVIVRSAFLEGIGRYERLFRDNPPSLTLQFTERVPMVKGRHDPDATTATSYCWLVWMMGESMPRMGWIPPCRKRLERAGDAA
ncbi:methyltransferase [Paracoccus suum]|uniref:Methyltransferase n=1 Tax=Paracoccus suum TaxID=2259340 RepID=A0A344PKY5_9RHOB|nr:methyltransferase [Paracoccus suum]AXC50040.1 methyltransferase [Paracoccus suum]